MYNCRQIQAARVQKLLIVVRFMYHYTINGDFASGLLQFIVSVGEQKSESRRTAAGNAAGDAAGEAAGEAAGAEPPDPPVGSL